MFTLLLRCNTGQLKLLKDMERKRHDYLLERFKKLTIVLCAIDDSGDGLEHSEAGDLLAVRLIVDNAAGRVAGKLHSARSGTRAGLIE